MFIYLAGPRPKDDNGWALRANIIEGLKAAGYSVFDPWAAWCGGAKPGPAAAVVNLAAVDACNTFLAYCPDTVAATGTAIEIGYALAKEKKVLLWENGVEGVMFDHPHICYVADIRDVRAELGVGESALPS